MADSKRSDAEDDLSAAQSVPKHLQPFMQGIKDLYASRDDADLLINCCGREWAVHKAIVRSQWPFVDKALKNYKEGKEGVIYLKGDDPAVIAGLIEFLYTFDYSTDGLPAMIFHIHMFIIADKYLIKSLANLALLKFEKICKDTYSPDETADAAHTLYTIGSHCTEMKKIIVNEIVHGWAGEILDEKRQEHFTKLNEALDTTTLGADVARACMGKADPLSAAKIYSCRECGLTVTAIYPTGCTIFCSNNYVGCNTLKEETAKDCDTA